jgi:hypothetical protein
MKHGSNTKKARKTQEGHLEEEKLQGQQKHEKRQTNQMARRAKKAQNQNKTRKKSSNSKIPLNQTPPNKLNARSPL